jgi:hypothetical protein
LAESTIEYVNEKLLVLRAAKQYANKLTETREIECPACGQNIDSLHFKEHVEHEETQLDEINKVFASRTESIDNLVSIINDFNRTMILPELETWKDEQIVEAFTISVDFLTEFDIQDLKDDPRDEKISALKDHMTPIMELAQESSKTAPTEVTKLTQDQTTVTEASRILSGSKLRSEIDKINNLRSTIEKTEACTREYIHDKSAEVIEEISEDIQRMWLVLHPGEQITDVKLYVPDDTDKAIDIGLNFFGTNQDSPRLTLSEGNRNGLGLCIYLSMAKRENDLDRPLILDDVVISLDRFHRGMIVELLQSEFADRQVIVLTHDREWFTELKFQLDERVWLFKTLLPYETPAEGIRWSGRTSTFDDARALLTDRPDSAGSDARKIMDVQLSIIAEKLFIKLPYLRGLKNDRRLAHEFLSKIISIAPNCFQHKPTETYETYDEAITALREADVLILSWANRAAHTFDIVRPEAERLITTCETSLDYFSCNLCGKFIWFADAAGPQVKQCECGNIRWRYGRG